MPLYGPDDPKKALSLVDYYCQKFDPGHYLLLSRPTACLKHISIPHDYACSISDIPLLFRANMTK